MVHGDDDRGAPEACPSCGGDVTETDSGYQCVECGAEVVQADSRRDYEPDTETETDGGGAERADSGGEGKPPGRHPVDGEDYHGAHSAHRDGADADGPDDVRYCPGCGSDVDILGTFIEDRRIVDCPDCGLVEAVYYEISLDDPTDLLGFDPREGDPRDESQGELSDWDREGQSDQ